MTSYHTHPNWPPFDLLVLVIIRILWNTLCITIQIIILTGPSVDEWFLFFKIKFTFINPVTNNIYICAVSTCRVNASDLLTVLRVKSVDPCWTSCKGATTRPIATATHRGSRTEPKFLTSLFGPTEVYAVPADSRPTSNEDLNPTFVRGRSSYKLKVTLCKRKSQRNLIYGWTLI